MSCFIGICVVMLIRGILEKNIVSSLFVIPILLCTALIAIALNKHAFTARIASDGTPWQGKQVIEHQAEVKQIAIPGIDKMYFKANKKAQKVNIYNPESNDCTMTFGLFIGDDILWYSEKCYPGYGFYDIKLMRCLEPGTYKARLLHMCERDGIQLNSANLNVEIIVE